MVFFFHSGNKFLVFLQSCCSVFRKCCWICSPSTPHPPPQPSHPKATVPPPTPPEVTLIVCDSSISLLPCIYSTFLLLYYRAMNYLDNRCLHQVMDCFFFFHPLDPNCWCAEKPFLPQKPSVPHKRSNIILFVHFLAVGIHALYTVLSGIVLKLVSLRCWFYHNNDPLQDNWKTNSDNCL